MQKAVKSGNNPIITLKQRMELIFLGIFLFLILLELTLRLGGLIIHLDYGSSNKITGNVMSEGKSYTILTLGESTTDSHSAGSLGFSWPKILEDILNNQSLDDKSSDIKFHVFNVAKGGTNTALILSDLVENLDKYRPDIVITMMGINDDWSRLYYVYKPESKFRLFVDNIRVYRMYKLIYSNYKRMSNKGGNTTLIDTEMEENLSLSDELLCGNLEENLSLSDELLCGRYFFNSKKFEEAEDAFKRALELDPENSFAYWGLGDTYQTRANGDQAKSKKARDFYKKSLEIDSKNAFVYIGLGLACRNLDKYQEAEDAFKKALELDPENSFAYWALGDVCQIQKEYQEAEDAFKKALELDPEKDSVYSDLGDIYLASGNYKEAEVAFKKTIYLDTVDKAAAMYKLFIIYNNQSRNIPVDIKTMLEEKNVYLKEISITVNNKNFVQSAVGETEEEAIRENTKYHYQLLYDILKERGIKLVVMQYPTRGIQAFKDFYNITQQNDILFVSNEENFKKALGEHTYEEIFVDRFAGDFGHCTPKGNSLIAENVAEVVLKEVYQNEK